MNDSGFEILLQAIYKSFTLKKNLVAIIHLLIGAGTLAVFTITGRIMGAVPLSRLYPVLGSILVYYILIRMTYILSFFALKETGQQNPPPYQEAVQAFGRQRWLALLAPIVLVVLLGIAISLQILILKSLGLIPVAGSVVNALLFLPFFVINFFLLLVIFFGGNILYAIMIQAQTNILDTIKAVCLLIIRQARVIVVYWLLASLLIFSGSLVLLFISGLAVLPALGGAFYNLLPIIRTGINLNFMLNTGLISELINPVTAVIMLFNLVLIVTFILSFLINIQVGVNISIFRMVQEAAGGEEKDGKKKKVIKAST